MHRVHAVVVPRDKVLRAGAVSGPLQSALLATAPTTRYIAQDPNHISVGNQRIPATGQYRVMLVRVLEAPKTSDEAMPDV